MVRNKRDNIVGSRLETGKKVHLDNGDDGRNRKGNGEIGLPVRRESERERQSPNVKHMQTNKDREIMRKKEGVSERERRCGRRSEGSRSGETLDRDAKIRKQTSKGTKNIVQDVNSRVRLVQNSESKEGKIIEKNPPLPRSPLASTLKRTYIEARRGGAKACEVNRKGLPSRRITSYIR